MGISISCARFWGFHSSTGISGSGVAVAALDFAVRIVCILYVTTYTRQLFLFISRGRNNASGWKPSDVDVFLNMFLWSVLWCPKRHCCLRFNVTWGLLRPLMAMQLPSKHKSPKQHIAHSCPAPTCMCIPKCQCPVGLAGSFVTAIDLHLKSV